MRSMRRAAEQLLEVVLLRRASSLSNTTVSASTARQSSRSSSALPLPMNHVWSGAVAALHDAADLVGAGGVDQQRRARRGWPRCRRRSCRRERDADEHDRSRMVRSMSVAPSASLYGVLSVDARPRLDLRSWRRTWPGRSSVTRPTGRAISAPWHRRRPCARRFRRVAGDQTPLHAAAHAAAQAPVPQASVMPAPRSCTRIVIAFGSGPGSTISRLTSGTCCAERDEVDARRRRRRRRPCAGCRRLRCATGRSGWIEPSRVPTVRLVDRRRRRPCRRSATIARLGPVT